MCFKIWKTALVAALALFLAGELQQASAQIYKIRPDSGFRPPSELVLDIPLPFGITNNSLVQQYQWNGGQNQKWYLERVPGTPANTYYIRSFLNKKALDVPNGTTRPINVGVSTFNGQQNQQWKLEPKSDGSFVIRSAASNLVLDVPNGATVPVWIQQYPLSLPNGSANQHWRLIPVAP